MFVLVWVCHEHQHGVSIQISINLGKTFLRVFVYEIFLWPESWQESLHGYLLTFPRLLTCYLLKDFDFDLWYFEWRDTENQQYSKCFVNCFHGTYLEGYSFIRLSCKKKILPRFVWWFNPLFISWHEAMPWSDAFCYLWIIYLQVKSIESLLSILKQVKIQWDTQSATGSSLTLIHSEWGRAVLLRILGWGGEPPGSPNPDPMINETQFWHLSRNYVIIAQIRVQTKILQIHFEFAIFSFFLTQLELKR